MSNYMDVLTNRSVLAMYTSTLIALLEYYALSKGMNGTFLSVSIAAIAGLGVYSYMGRKVAEAKND